jgi:polyisoprenoid-binding protein YceI
MLPCSSDTHQDQLQESAVTLASSSACRPDSTPITDAWRTDAEQSHARFVAVTLASSSACRPDSTPITDAWRTDAEQSHARFVAATLRSAAKVRGAFDPPSGSLVADAEGAKGTLAIDAASVNTSNRLRDRHLRDRHLRGRDFFGVAKHPQLSYARRSLTYHAGEDGRELVESYSRAFAPQSGSPWRKRLRDEVNYRAQLGYPRSSAGLVLSPLRHAPAMALGAASAGAVPGELRGEHSRSPQQQRQRRARALPALASRALVAKRDGRQAGLLPSGRDIPALTTTIKGHR